MEGADKVCNLECVKDENVHEFVGPVKIVLVDSPASVCRMNKMIAGLATVSYILMGAAVMPMLFFSIFYIFSPEHNYNRKTDLSMYNRIHMFLCTVGLQVCFPCGILMPSTTSLPASASPRCQYVFIRACGLTVAMVGALLVVFLAETEEPMVSVHFITGVVACGLGMMAAFGGIVASILENTGIFTKLHASLRILAFISSSICFSLGVNKEVFMYWGKDTLVSGYATAFCVVYTAVAVGILLKNLFSKT